MSKIVKTECLLRNRYIILRDILKITKTRYLIEILKVILTIIKVVGAEIILDKLIFDSLAARSSFLLTNIYIILFFIIMSIDFIFKNWFNNVFIPKSDILIKSHVKEKIYSKLMIMDLQLYDDPDFYNKKIWACNDIDGRYIQILNTFFCMVSSVLTFIVLIISSLILEPMLLVFAVVFTGSTIWLNKYYSKANYEFEKNSVFIKRCMEYPKTIFFSVSSAKDIRITGLPQLLKYKYKESFYTYQKIIGNYGKKKAVISLFLLCIELLFGNWIPLLFVASKAILLKTYSVGTVSASISVISSLRKSVKNILDSIAQIQEQSLYIANYMEFNSYINNIKENESGIEPLYKANSIKLENVSYRYPNQDKYILKNININIKSGEKVAFVGHNGAGKTTLIKLILRLYLPQEGVIYLDEKPQDTYKLKLLRERFGVIFQDFQLYALNVFENVLMNSSIFNESNISTVNYALRRSGIYDRIYQEKYTIKTQLLKDYDKDGLILSGGQAQKLALSRIFAKECGVIIMDEPSSALDPKSEYGIFKSMLDVAKDKTLILISHRLSSTKDVDKIYFFENGQVMEEGSHDELMKKNGKYASMFLLQAKTYI